MFLRQGQAIHSLHIAYYFSCSLEKLQPGQRFNKRRIPNICPNYYILENETAHERTLDKLLFSLMKTVGITNIQSNLQKLDPRTYVAQNYFI